MIIVPLTYCAVVLTFALALRCWWGPGEKPSEPRDVRDFRKRIGRAG